MTGLGVLHLVNPNIVKTYHMVVYFGQYVTVLKDIFVYKDFFSIPGMCLEKSFCCLLFGFITGHCHGLVCIVILWFLMLSAKNHVQVVMAEK